MLKQLALKYWPLALLLILIGAVLCMSRYTEKRKAEHYENAQTGSPKPQIAPNDAGNGSHKTYETQYPPSWIDTFTWPDGVTAWALLMTLVVIAWQSAETRAAANATAASVEAANVQVGLIRKQMDTEIERERARLRLETQAIDIPESGFHDGVNLRTCIELTNVGHSNAYIGDGAVRFVASSGQWPVSPASPEDFAPFSRVIEPSKDPVYCPVDSEDIPLSLKDFATDIADGSRALFLYGFIEYKTMGIVWHRDFGYRWKIAEDSREPLDPNNVVFRDRRNPGGFCIAGWWESDVCHPNNEYRKETN
jgi:hypothetical protein